MFKNADMLLFLARLLKKIRRTLMKLCSQMLLPGCGEQRMTAWKVGVKSSCMLDRFLEDLLEQFNVPGTHHVLKLGIEGACAFPWRSHSTHRLLGDFSTEQIVLFFCAAASQGFVKILDSLTK